jgi:hypothetical protein
VTPTEPGGTLPRLRAAAITLLGATLAVVAGLPAASASNLPTPGTAADVAALVAASTSITSLPSDLVPALAKAPADTASTYYRKTGPGCPLVTSCVYGDESSSSLVVLFGDSHAQMWLPALAPVANQDGFKLALVWHPGCPFAALTVAWGVCTKYRTTAVASIAAAHAHLVLLANKTTNVVGPGGRIFTNAQWQAGVVTTIDALASPTTTVAVVGDITQLNSSGPQCLASYPTNVQKCSVFDPNPKYTQHFSAEEAAATATGAGYVATQPWLCTKRCAAVIGNMVAYSDQGHVTDTYAEYLSAVWAAALQPLLAG